MLVSIPKKVVVVVVVLHTYWFIKLVLPTPLSPRMMTFRRIFLRDDILLVVVVCMKCCAQDAALLSRRSFREAGAVRRLPEEARWNMDFVGVDSASRESKLLLFWLLCMELRAGSWFIEVQSQDSTSRSSRAALAFLYLETSRRDTSCR